MAKRYRVKEVFATLQGEGARAGSPAVFLRFSGCNLGYGVCPWCDTDWLRPDFTGDADTVVRRALEAARKEFGGVREGLLLVATGGEPTLQLDAPLSRGLRAAGFFIAVESNGSRPVDRSLVDWLTVSPKQQVYSQKGGDELKVVFTGRYAAGVAPDVEAVRRLAEGTSFDHYFLQPVDLPERGGPNFSETAEALKRLGPPWRLSVQTHKVLGIP
ncbi:MAG: 7-carboxy-7-deazaguanine synthase [Longimicrobiaceae bacterium]